MVVHQINNGEEPETEQMYEIFFKNNMDRLDLDSDNIDLELLEKFECAQFLGQRLQMINERWKKLTNINKHEKLQNAIKL